MYFLIKNIHISCAILTAISFFIRGIWMMQESNWLQKRWVKTVPHLIDTVLLVSGVMLAILSHQYPIIQTWLSAKFIALTFYIILGSIALKQGRTKTIRVYAWGSALGVLAYIAIVALKRLPNPFL